MSASLDNSKYESDFARNSSYFLRGARSIDPNVLFLAILPLFLFAFDATWLFGYTGSAYIDTWVYFGYMLDLSRHLRAFKGAYYGNRLGWLIPGAIAYRYFPPVVATYLIHSAFCAIALLALYLTLRAPLGRRAALLSAILMGSYYYFLTAIGWNVPDGAAVTYFLLSLSLMSPAIGSDRPQWWFLAAGAAFGLAVHSHLFLINFVPLVALYYGFVGRERKYRHFLQGLTMLAFGFILTTGLLGLASLLAGGDFWFFLDSVREANQLVTHANSSRFAIHKWITDEPQVIVRLVLPGAVFIGVLLSLFCRRSPDSVRNRVSRFWQYFFVACVLILVVWEWRGQPVFELFYYVSFLIPATFLALGAQLAGFTESLSSWQFTLFALLSLSLPAILPTYCPRLLPLNHRLVTTFAIALSGITAVYWNGRYSKATRACALLLIPLAISVVNITVDHELQFTDSVLLQELGESALQGAGNLHRSYSSQLQREAFLAIIESDRAVQKWDRSDGVKFWYNYHDRYGPLQIAVASTYLWGFRLVSEDFPGISGTMSAVPAVGSRVVILSSDDSAVSKAKPVLAGYGLDARALAQQRIHEGPFVWNMFEIEIIRGTPRGQTAGGQ